MTDFRAHRGFMLITVLIVTAVGLLFGAGALLLFRYQCQLRIDRQHELEKVFSVRSALNFIRTAKSDISETGSSFRFQTESGRDLGLLVKPVPQIFPSDSYEPPEEHPLYRHFFMERGEFQVPMAGTGGYDENLDYEYGAIGVTNLSMSTVDPSDAAWPQVGLGFTDTAATNGVKWWVNIGMRGTGGWLQQDYGRRYYFYLKHSVGDQTDTATRDLIRLCIIRNVTNALNAVGCRHGWPLSREGERALVLECRDGMIALSEYVYEGGIIEHPLPVYLSGQTQYNMGIQVADDKISLFYIDAITSDSDGPPRCVFSSVTNMTTKTYGYFTEGAIRNDEGKIVQAPELRAVLEVEASSSMRNSSALNNSHVDFLTNLRVTPAYQYDIFLEHPAFVTNRATVAQRTGPFSRSKIGYKVLTYDTHGTENKGFRKDEREARNRR